tara:strand:+ start:79 stop:291 length:213 start_codon:yes stop_codon:yes gene_type:complete
MLTFYLLVLIVLLMIAYAGFEGTMRVFAYLDLQLRFLVVRIRMYFMGRKLRKQLIRIKEELDAESKRHKD